ncbi:MAG: hypothetical protein MUF53_04550 [Gemmatimonadaceae bacterium]|jgi:hypothetical protein|nr:hypothetical protein [Gemmatimonadaceae bacterium]
MREVMREVMRDMVRLAAAALLWAAPAAAQVGSMPERSPFADAPYRQGLTAFTGWWNAGRDPAGVAPQSAPVIGARYDWSIGSAGSLYLRQQAVLSSRDPIDPFRSAAQRALGTYRWPLSVTDAGFAMQLTGQKAWRGLMPNVALGLGMLTDFVPTRDVGGYSVGTNFMFTGGAGTTVILGERWRLRLDGGLFVHRYRYPDTYITQTPPVVTQSQLRGGWRVNSSLTAGLHWTVFR